MWNLKTYNTNKLIYKPETDWDTGNTFMITKEGRGRSRRDKEEFGNKRCTQLYIKQVNNKVILYSTGNYIWYLVITYNGKNLKKDIYNIQRFWILKLEKTLKSPLDSKEIKLVNPKRNQFWIFIGRTDANTLATWCKE